MSYTFVGTFTDSRTDFTSGKRVFYRVRNKYRTTSPKPWVSPVPYSHVSGFTATLGPVLMVDAANDGACTYARGSSSDDATVLRKALSRFSQKMGDSAQIGADLGEARQSLDMIVKRATQLRSFAKAVNRFDIPGAVDVLRDAIGTERSLGYRAKGLAWEQSRPRGEGTYWKPKGSPTRRQLSESRRYVGAKRASNAFLEVHFGWEPLIKDIYSAIDVLQSPTLSRKKISGSGSKNASSSSPMKWPGYAGQNHQWTWGRETRCKVGATVTVTNPNAFLANQLGLINPASVLWELVPWSFVVDWFYPVGDFLDSFTRFTGVLLEDSYTTFRRSAGGSDLFWYWTNKDKVELQGGGTSQGFSMSRTLGISEFAGWSSTFKAPSAVRAATAISLLVQLLPPR